MLYPDLLEGSGFSSRHTHTHTHTLEAILKQKEYWVLDPKFT
jgi:hypothetical protein